MELKCIGLNSNNATGKFLYTGATFVVIPKTYEDELLLQFIKEHKDKFKIVYEISEANND